MWPIPIFQDPDPRKQIPSQAARDDLAMSLGLSRMHCGQASSKECLMTALTGNTGTTECSLVNLGTVITTQPIHTRMHSQEKWTEMT